MFFPRSDNDGSHDIALFDVPIGGNFLDGSRNNIA
jgi:hypothetical protein